MRNRILVAVVVLGALVLLIQQKSDAPVITNSPKPIATAKPQPFKENQYSLTDPSSIWVVVNKQRPLTPKNFTPTDLITPNVKNRVSSTQVRSIVVSPLEQLFGDADRNGTPLRLSSGYRSYSYQVGLYDGYVAKQGQQQADAQSARPGFSEHQTGLAVDVSPSNAACEVQTCFAETPAGKWVAANAHKYGFIIRYGDGQKAITGYDYEPWHLRYVGLELATEMRTQNTATLEAFFKLGNASDY